MIADDAVAVALTDALRREADPARLDALVALAAEMAANGRDRHAPVRELFAMLGDRWSLLILLVLAAGPCRHAALRRTVSLLASEEMLSQRVMTLKLRALERSGLVGRTVTSDIPPRVDYALSGIGGELVSHARLLIGWIASRKSAIEVARANFDRFARNATDG